MIPWVQLDAAPLPEGGELRLMQRGAEFSIMAGSLELMNSRRSGSEVALATLSAEALGPRQSAQVLIGGLGMGFTLGAARTAWGADARFTVAELVPAVVAWARGPLAGVVGDSFEDSRVTIREADVGALIRSAYAAYDAILLDVDNGPHGMGHASNDDLYDRAGLLAARRALRPRGVLAVWSAASDPQFVARMRRAGFGVTEHQVRAHRGKGPRHIIWLGVSPG